MREQLSHPELVQLRALVHRERDRLRKQLVRKADVLDTTDAIQRYEYLAHKLTTMLYEQHPMIEAYHKLAEHRDTLLPHSLEEGMAENVLKAMEAGMIMLDLQPPE